MEDVDGARPQRSRRDAEIGGGDRGAARLGLRRRCGSRSGRRSGNDYIDRRGGGVAVGADRGADPADLRAALRRRLRRDPAADRARPTTATSPSCGSSTPTARRRSCRATAPARRCSTCGAAGWTDADTFTVLTKAGEVTPTITGPNEVSMAIGRAVADLARLPRRGPRTARGTVELARARVELPARQRRQPAVRDRGRRRGRGRSTSAGSARRSSRTSCFRTAPTSRSSSVDGSTVRARIFERGVGETLSSGTGASGAAVAAFLGGAPSPITVSLDGGDAHRRGHGRPRRHPDRNGLARLRRRARPGPGRGAGGLGAAPGPASSAARSGLHVGRAAGATVGLGGDGENDGTHWIPFVVAAFTVSGGPARRCGLRHGTSVTPLTEGSAPRDQQLGEPRGDEPEREVERREPERDPEQRVGRGRVLGQVELDDDDLGQRPGDRGDEAADDRRAPAGEPAGDRSPRA